MHIYSAHLAILLIFTFTWVKVIKVILHKGLVVIHYR